MQSKFRLYVAVFATFLMFTLVCYASAAGSITLNPTSQAAGGTVSVSGSGFGTTKPVGIGFGAEVAGSNANMSYTGTGMGPYSGRLSHYPIKPGSFVLTSDTSSGAGIVSTYTDRGDGTTTWSYDDTVMGTIDYVTGAWSRSTTVDVTGIATNYSATYVCYQYNLTSSAGLTSDGLGAFSAAIAVPSVANGNYDVTAVDTAGNKGVSSLGVSGVIPENIPVALTLLASTIAVIVASVMHRKKSKSS